MSTYCNIDCLVVSAGIQAIRGRKCEQVNRGQGQNEKEVGQAGFHSSRYVISCWKHLNQIWFMSQKWVQSWKKSA
jgi:hypothetical protein